ncbi:hexose phosphate transporter [Mesomycoplasma conjunctivae]|uniref:hexose phosphate transporter n=1 Tax=Mesomycoplasma conjunctivae TaxID=45361 RepID=UPI003DA2D8C9
MQKSNFILNFATKHTKEKKLTFTSGLILLVLLLFAYLLFVINWGFPSAGLAGKAGGQGINGYYFPTSDAAPPTIVNQAVNWGITIGRAIGSILVGWLIVKVSHKYAVIISLVLMLFGIIAPYSPSYAGFIILRTIFAIGGTMQIVFIQPIISNYMNSRQKAVVSQFAPFVYPIGTIITLIPFVASDSKVISGIQSHWQTILLVISLLTLIPLIGYMILGTKFDLYPSAIEREKANPNKEQLSIMRFLKQKDTWYWTILYGSWLMAVVLPFALSKGLFHRLVPELVISPGIFDQKINSFLIIFLCGMFVGPFIVGLVSKYQIKRRGFIASVISLGVTFYVLGAITFVYGASHEGPNTYGGYSILFLIFGLLMGTCLWGIQGVILNLPHEYKGSNPKKVGYQFGLIWGLGYTAFTIGNIVVSLINTPPGIDIKADVNLSYNWAAAALATLVIFSLAASVGITLLKEPNPDYISFFKLRKSNLKKIIKK